MSNTYRLDPGARQSGIKPEGIVGWLLIIFSPFVAFAIHGTVEAEALAWVVLPLCAGAALVAVGAVRVWRGRRALPIDIREQVRLGKVLPVLPSANAGSSLSYDAASHGRGRVALDARGLLIGPGASLRSSRWADLPVMAQAQIEGASPYPLSWAEVVEWQVHDGGDQPAHYTMICRDGAHLSMQRPRDRALEPVILDYVRSVGQRPVRLFDDAGPRAVG